MRTEFIYIKDREVILESSEQREVINQNIILQTNSQTLVIRLPLIRISVTSGYTLAVYVVYSFIYFQLILTKIYIKLKPQDSFGRFVKNFLDLQKVDHTIRKHH